MQVFQQYIINYKISWLLSLVGSVELKSLIPVFGQIFLIFFAQLITFIFEFLKQKYLNRKSRKDYDEKVDKLLDKLDDPTKFR